MNLNRFKVTYNVDMVFCIDATGSMGGVIDMVKNNAIHLYEDVMASMAQKGKTIDTLRVKLVAFRDYIADGQNAMLASEFYHLPQQSAEFEECVKSTDIGELGLCKSVYGWHIILRLDLPEDYTDIQYNIEQSFFASYVDNKTNEQASEYGIISKINWDLVNAEG